MYPGDIPYEHCCYWPELASYHIITLLLFSLICASLVIYPVNTSYWHKASSLLPSTSLSLKYISLSLNYIPHFSTPHFSTLIFPTHPLFFQLFFFPPTEDNIKSLPRLLASSVGRDIEQLYRSANGGKLEDVTLLQKITEVIIYPT